MDLYLSGLDVPADSCFVAMGWYHNLAHNVGPTQFSFLITHAGEHLIGYRNYVGTWTGWHGTWRYSAETEEVVLAFHWDGDERRRKQAVLHRTIRQDPNSMWELRGRDERLRPIHNVFHRFYKWSDEDEEWVVYDPQRHSNL